MTKPNQRLTTKKPLQARLARFIRRIYYKHIYAKKILKTAPVVCDKNAHFEIHALACEQDLLNTLWSLKTFYLFCESRPRLVIYEDGSISKDALRIVSEHFVNCEIIRRRRFHSDMEDFLKDYPISLEYSRMQTFYCALKLFGPMYYTQAERFIYFDSDVLFFQKPRELLKNIENGTPCYSNDYQDAYAYPVKFLNKLLSITMAHEVNAGLMHTAKRDFADNLDLVEDYFTKVPQLDNTSWMVNRHEQTLAAILLSKANAIQLGSNYQISKKAITDTTISHHFVNDGSRPDFYGEGLRRLKKNRAIEKLKCRTQQS